MLLLNSMFFEFLNSSKSDVHILNYPTTVDQTFHVGQVLYLACAYWHNMQWTYG